MKPCAKPRWQQSLALADPTDFLDARRGFIANLTIIEGDTGQILIDPLLSGETAGGGLLAQPCRRPTAQ